MITNKDGKKSVCSPEVFKRKFLEYEKSFNLKTIEKEIIYQALTNIKTKKEAAIRLGISKNTLRTKIVNYGLENVKR